MAWREFALAQELLEASGALKEGPPTSMEVVQEYLAGQGLEVRYYDPTRAPSFIQEAAARIDEALVPEGSRFFLFINQDRSLNRLRFSFFHGVGHFCLPGHRKLSYLGKGCQVQPLSTRPYERQAHCFAAAMNMPPRLFREDMSSLPFGLRAVENLSQRYVASMESAAIHYVSLADAPCAALWIEPEYDECVLPRYDLPLRVRYQVRSPSFAHSIRSGSAISLGDNVFWLCSRDGLIGEDDIEGSILGLRKEVRLRVDCLPQGKTGAALALVSPANMPAGSPVYREWSWED